MAVNPIQFLVASNASILDGTKTISISGNVDCSRVYSGTAVFLGGAYNPAEAVSGTSPDGSGVSTITLRNNWSQGDISNQPLVSFNTNEGLAEAISNVREIVSNVSAIEDLATQGLIKRIDDNNYEVVDITSLGESLVGANDASTARGVLGLGSAATRDVISSSADVVTGKVLTNVADFNFFALRSFGSYYPSTANRDIDSVVSGDIGLYATGNQGTFPLNPDVGFYHIQTQQNYTGESRSQFATGYFGTNASNNAPTYSMRTMDNNGEGWTPWVNFYHSGNSVNPLDYGIGDSTPSDIGDAALATKGGVFKDLGGSTNAADSSAWWGSLLAMPSDTGKGFLHIRHQQAGSVRAWVGRADSNGNNLLWEELYHSGNTNFNEFGGAGADSIVATGVGRTNSEILFYLPINSFTEPTGISVNVGFNVRGENNIEIGNENLMLANTFSGTLSSTRYCVLIVGGLSNINVGQTYRLQTVNNLSKIIVNF